MKKAIIVFLLICGLFISQALIMTYAQDTTSGAQQNDTTAVAEEKAAPEEEITAVEEAEAPKQGHELLKQWFIDGDPTFMSLPLICLILGLAFSIERIITLSLATTNTSKLLSRIDEALKNGNVDQAKEICKKDRSPIASVIYQGLDRLSEGIEIVEKSIVSYGSVQMGLMEKGLVWISLFIALAPMLGFLGTVVGMVEAFDAIQAAGDISPSLVAGGIKVALLTTLFGLIVAIILQVFYNYIISKIDSIVNKMEDASISFVDMLVRYKLTK